MKLNAKLASLLTFAQFIKYTLLRKIQKLYISHANEFLFFIFEAEKYL